MLDRTPPPTRTQIIVDFAREVIVLVLAFVAGVGVYLAGIADGPLRIQDYWGAAAAGCTAVLLRMFPVAPTRGGTRQ